ncbi:hypothetical protein RND71_034711 [Anisodus tanguticus]|uniref:FHA domain-containing protein n=1 Tax=Anisodus tanguticus TaxID=243964 RepID=A0AAE1R3G4_9SOLA|nr:hypothetical protein RND71_034711 [Anisodus tanguticus]
MGRSDSRSPARGRGSPCKRSPLRRERSPARERSSHAASSAIEEKPSSRNKSPRRARSRSPVPLSPARERPSSRNKSPKRRKSISPTSHSPIREKPSSRTKSPKRAKSRSPYSKLLQGENSSGRARSPSPRTKRLQRAEREAEEKPRERGPEKNHGRASDRAIHREKNSDRMVPESRSPSPRTKRLRRAEREAEEKSRERKPEKNQGRASDRATHREKDSGKMVPESRSPSPQTKRLRRAERDAEEKSREPEKNHGRASDRATQREKDSDRMVERERREKKPGKDAIDNGSHKSRNGRSDSPSERQYKSRHRSRSPAAADSRAHTEATNSRRGEHRNGEDDSLSKMEEAEKALEAKNKDKPSFELSGKLAAETNRVRGITLLFNEPPDARKPDIRWRLYVFKGGEVLNEPLYVHRQSCYLFGRERRVADIPTDHPSCSKQHAVLQYRQVEKDNLDGTSSKQVRCDCGAQLFFETGTLWCSVVWPYVMDLGSTNGTFINETRIESERYYELFEKDTLKFGNSSREYVLLHENSA